ncbi:SAM-dependent methyltransferase [Thermomonospora umbrina]|uniref:Methyltransferase family protein n=1 Tax=Thermomonospora umbrina TaxID=111806 RepID=A0A3D9SIJ2_9ACTN|nr:class I SAM-dependent methyltransferase [Thermomonospora umbrina]REE95748.1 methyltransferase family protein [Thermomonospora umbrina]
MTAVKVPERLRWAVDTLAVRPEDRLLEIGCGRGVAVALICPLLSEGRITAVDRSATALEAARRRNAAHLATGRAELHRASLESLDLPGRRFDKIFAVNVNHFWVRAPDPELNTLKDLLTPDGALHLFYEPPSATKATELTTKLLPALTRNGLTTTVITGGETLLCLKATTP